MRDAPVCNESGAADCGTGYEHQPPPFRVAEGDWPRVRDGQVGIREKLHSRPERTAHLWRAAAAGCHNPLS
jgi:hypothetical protein